MNVREVLLILQALPADAPVYMRGIEEYDEIQNPPSRTFELRRITVDVRTPEQAREVQVMKRIANEPVTAQDLIAVVLLGTYEMYR